MSSSKEPRVRLLTSVAQCLTSMKRFAKRSLGHLGFDWRWKGNFPPPSSLIRSAGLQSSVEKVSLARVVLRLLELFYHGTLVPRNQRDRVNSFSARIAIRRILPSNSGYFPSCAAALFTFFSFLSIYLISTLYIPPLIKAAYRDQASPFFNRFIHARATSPLQIYLDHWTGIQSLLLTTTLVTGGIFTLAAFPPFQSAIDRWIGPIRRDSAYVQTPLRLPVLLGVLIIVTQVAEIYVNRECWPFLVYSMYAAPQAPEISWDRVYGIARDGREFQLYASPYTPPFTDVEVAYSLDYLLHRPEPARLDAALSGCYKLYLDARKLGRHHGPDLQALRIYRLTWHVEKSLRNKEIPDSKQQMYEFRVPR